MSNSTSKRKIGVFINNGCGTNIDEQIVSQIADSVYFSGLVEDKKHIIYQKGMGKAGAKFIIDQIKRFGFGQVVIAGYSPEIHRASIESIARNAGLEPGYFRAVPLPADSGVKDDDFIPRTAYEIGRAAKWLQALPEYEKQTIELHRRVLIIGGGVAGIEAATACKKLGLDVVVVDQAPDLGGDAKIWRDREVAPLLEIEPMDPRGLEGTQVYTRSTLAGLSGSIGNFEAEIETFTDDGMERKTESVGAIILAHGLRPDILFPEELYEILKSDHAEPINHIADHVKEMPPVRGVRHVGLILDLYQDETKASTEMALAIADSVQDRDRFQVHIFLRDVRVAAKGLQQYYDDVRDKGVNIVKYSDIDFRVDDGGIVVDAEDAVLMRRIEYSCNLIGISGYGLPQVHDTSLMEITGVLPDRAGELQENNIHLFPVETNRPGIFIAGSSRGTRYVPRIIEESRAAALAVYNELKDGSREVLCDQVQVDPDKCILCLTCVRCCPYKAMHVDREAGTAVSYPEECQKCGICAGECPAKAITLPEYSDNILLEQLQG